MARARVNRDSVRQRVTGAPPRSASQEEALLFFSTER